MLNKHLTDEEVQQFVLDSSGIDATTMSHIYTCEKCKASIETYQILFTGIKQFPEPAFDFNLSELVLPNLDQQQARKSSENLFLYLFTLAAISIMGAGLYFTQKYWIIIFEGIASYAVYLIAITAIIISVIFSLDIYKNYKKKMNQLNFY